MGMEFSCPTLMKLLMKSLEMLCCIGSDALVGVALNVLAAVMRQHLSSHGQGGDSLQCARSRHCISACLNKVQRTNRSSVRSMIPTAGTCQSVQNCHSQSEALVLRGLGFSMLRIPLEAVSGILFAIYRSDMRWVSIEIWSSDPKLLFVRIDRFPQLRTGSQSLCPCLALYAHDIDRQPVPVAAAE